jgi:hypothetical protein
MEREEYEGSGSVVSSLFPHGLIGAGAALPVAPMGGWKTGEEIRSVAGNGKETADDYYELIKKASVLKINTEVFNGNVTLSGAVPNREAEEHLISLARSVKGVKSVTSKLTVQRE